MDGSERALRLVCLIIIAVHNKIGHSEMYLKIFTRARVNMYVVK